MDDVSLYIRWKCNKKLLELKVNIENNFDNIWVANKEYNNLLEWIPKTTLAFKDINCYNAQQIDYNAISLKKQTMIIKEISIIEYKENTKEKELKKFILNKEN